MMMEAIVALQVSKSAITSKTLRFLAAGGLTLAIALWREIAKADTDWGLVAAMIASLVIGVGGGAYGRVVAQGPVTAIFADLSSDTGT